MQPQPVDGKIIQEDSLGKWLVLTGERTTREVEHMKFRKEDLGDSIGSQLAVWEECLIPKYSHSARGNHQTLVQES